MGRMVEVKPVPPLPCVVICAWDAYHMGRGLANGLVVCNECERPVVCIEHDGHGAMLATGQPIGKLDRTGGLCIPCATSFDCKAHPNQEESVGRFCRCGFREPCGRVGHCVNQEVKRHD